MHWPMPAILAPQRLKQDYCKFEVRLGYRVRAPSEALAIAPYHSAAAHVLEQLWQ